MRRFFAFSVCFFALLAFPAHAQNDSNIVTIESGKVQGMVAPDSPNVHFFLGIPYGASTADENMFAPPQKPRAWTNVKPVTTYGPACYQSHHNPDAPSYQSFDCLNLNVFAPIPAGAGLLPVMVFIHGGAFQEGSNQGPFGIYNGTHIASQHNVVVVTIQYRLGAFGFMSLGGDQGLGGNYGIMDQILALEWVQRNIAAFGGDKMQVTVFGESAGAMSIGILLLVEQARGLFSKALMESNPAAFNYHNQTEAAVYGNSFCSYLGCAAMAVAGSASASTCNVPCMRAKDGQTIMDAWEQTVNNATNFIVANGGHILDGFLSSIPTVDPAGGFLTEEPQSAFLSGNYWAAQDKIPLMAGTNAGEGQTFIYGAQGKPVTPLDTFLCLDAVFAFNQTVIGMLEENPRYSPFAFTDGREAMSHVMTDYWFRCGTENALLGQASAGAPTYEYKYAHVFSNASLFVHFGLPAVCATTACHATELPFVFDEVPTQLANFTSAEAEMSRMMVTFWTNFAKTGDPNKESALTSSASTASSYPTWPLWTPLDRLALVFQNGTDTAQESGAGICSFWDKIGYFH